MFRLFRNEKGFTMIEMMVVLIIIAVLIGGGIKFYTGYISKSKETKAKGDITTIQAALDTYYAENNRYPNADELATGARVSTDFVNTTGNVPYIYIKDNPTNGYTVHTRVKVSDKFVKGTGVEGRSEAPITTDTVP